jgi:hypothetical protein
VIARVLPPEEWSRLEGTPLGEAWHQLPTTGLTIYVVEDGAGSIVGHWTLFTTLVAEHLWVAPAHQKRGVVVGRLRRALHDDVVHAGARGYMTFSASAEVTRLLEHHLGATRLPGDAYRVPVSSKR